MAALIPVTISSAMLLRMWRVMGAVPGGGRAMGAMLGRFAPYTGTIGVEVVSLERGRAVVGLRDRRPVRNHLNSVHAMALCNFAEVASGLAFISAWAPESRGILTGFRMEYLAKARGTLRATAEYPPIETNERSNHDVAVEVTDTEGKVVARAVATWRLGPA
jgi:acyl-coenzyme A thioesterase PaaI-like protein